MGRGFANIEQWENVTIKELLEYSIAAKKDLQEQMLYIHKIPARLHIHGNIINW